MKADFYDIIIVGAGPTGLMMAAQLNRFNIRFLILDKKSGPTTESRALTVQARSMEIYEQMGLSNDVVREGSPSGGISLFKNGKKRTSVFLRTMGQSVSPFPYIMIYEQNKNENLLYHHLQACGTDVQWNTEIQIIEKKDSEYCLQTMSKEAGQSAYICRFLVACDGARSLVREQSGMDFTGGTYENVFYVADTHASSKALSAGMLSLFLTRKTFTMLFPLPGKDRFRLMGILPKEYYHHNTIHFDALMQNVQKSIQFPIQFYDTNWYSTYKLHHKKVACFNQENIFFAGDAAHVHSPAGGQGMNTGLQDAYNLAWKMALVVQRKAKTALLQTYHEERNPIAEKLLKTTDRLFTIMSNSNIFFGFIKFFIVPRVVPLLNRFNKIRRLWFNEVSQTSINYSNSSLSLGKAGAIKAGIRFPYFIIQHNHNPISVYQLIKDNHITPFLVILYNVNCNGMLPLDPGLFTVFALQVSSENTAILQKKGFSKSFLVVLRPDNYIACIGETIDSAMVNHFMTNNYFLV